jgi:hypothetical protein
MKDKKKILRSIFVSSAKPLGGFTAGVLTGTFFVIPFTFLFGSLPGALVPMEIFTAVELFLKKGGVKDKKPSYAAFLGALSVILWGITKDPNNAIIPPNEPKLIHTFNKHHSHVSSGVYYVAAKNTMFLNSEVYKLGI